MRRLLVLMLTASLLACSGPDGGDEHGHDGAPEEPARGAHGGRLLTSGELAVELAIYESGTPPEFRAWIFDGGKPVPPARAKLEVRITRLGGASTVHTFAPEGEFLRGDATVDEPHSFDVEVALVLADGRHASWRHASYEGRTTIAAATAAAMGVVVERAGPQQLEEVLHLSGNVQADPARISRVRARYAGVIREVPVEPGQPVTRGQLLARVQSNESLQSYAVNAPIAGILVEHRAQAGEATGDEPLFTIIDVSKVWVELDVFQRELARVETGQRVVLTDLDGAPLASGYVARIAPLAMHGSQSVRARVAIEQASGTLRPGQFVSARVTVARHAVPLAVRREAVQRFRDFDVVFERVGDVYEVRMLELGRTDDRFVEITGGLAPGAEYVVENSYLIKADVEKSGASHDH
jgi:membrane fusion protein, heavy metal efflux system